jgi:hypothetical protein
VADKYAKNMINYHSNIQLTNKRVILEFDKPYFELKLEPDQLVIHVKESSIQDMRKLVEASPHLTDNLRWMFATIFPLHVKLSDIESVQCNKDNTQVNVKIPSKHDIHLPLDPPECQMLVEKLNSLKENNQLQSQVKDKV